MKEETVRLIMIKYFESKIMKAIPQRGAGPDLLIDGKAVEVKGSRFKFDRMLRQLLDYAYKYSDVSLALPFDGLTIQKAHKLSCFDEMIKHAKGKGLKVYIVAPHPKDTDLFCVREFRMIAEIWSVMGSPGKTELGYDFGDPDSAIVKAVENLIKYSPVERLKDYVCQEFLKREVTTVKI